MQNPVKTLEPNLVGRDFVVGDMHGCYSAFERLLKEIKFDPKTDRMISVGDLIDRGPQSLKCLQLLWESWFHSVLGNHEQMMLEKFAGGWMGASWYPNGGQWAMEAYNDYEAVRSGAAKGAASRRPYDESVALMDLLPLVEDLPYLITVNMKSGKKFHVIHAELANTGKIVTDEDLADPKNVMALATIKRNNGDAFLWSRAIFDSLYEMNLGNREWVQDALRLTDVRVFNDKLSHIISGHTKVQRPVTVVGQTNIDTGSYHSYWVPIEPYMSGGIVPKPWAGLTCVDLDAWKFYKATENACIEIEPFVITRDEVM